MADDMIPYTYPLNISRLQHFAAPAVTLANNTRRISLFGMFYACRLLKRTKTDIFRTAQSHHISVYAGTQSFTQSFTPHLKLSR
jgi:hypothetical protein